MQKIINKKIGIFLGLLGFAIVVVLALNTSGKFMKSMPIFNGSSVDGKFISIEPGTIEYSGGDSIEILIKSKISNDTMISFQTPSNSLKAPLGDHVLLGGTDKTYAFTVAGGQLYDDETPIYVKATILNNGTGANSGSGIESISGEETLTVKIIKKAPEAIISSVSPIKVTEFNIMNVPENVNRESFMNYLKTEGLNYSSMVESAQGGDSHRRMYVRVAKESVNSINLDSLHGTSFIAKGILRHFDYQSQAGVEVFELTEITEKPKVITTSISPLKVSEYNLMHVSENVNREAFMNYLMSEGLNYSSMVESAQGGDSHRRMYIRAAKESAGAINLDSLHGASFIAKGFLRHFDYQTQAGVEVFELTEITEKPMTITTSISPLKVTENNLMYISENVNKEAYMSYLKSEGLNYTSMVENAQGGDSHRRMYVRVAKEAVNTINLDSLHGASFIAKGILRHYDYQSQAGVEVFELTEITEKPKVMTTPINPIKVTESNLMDVSENVNKQAFMNYLKSEGLTYSSMIEGAQGGDNYRRMYIRVAKEAAGAINLESLNGTGITVKGILRHFDYQSQAGVEVFEITSGMSNAIGTITPSDLSPKKQLYLAGAKNQKILSFKVSSNEKITLKDIAITGNGLSKLSNMRLTDANSGVIGMLTSGNSDNTVSAFNFLDKSDKSIIIADKISVFHIIADINTNTDSVGLKLSVSLNGSNFISSDGATVKLTGGTAIPYADFDIAQNGFNISQVNVSNKSLDNNALEFNVAATGKNFVQLSEASFNNKIYGYVTANAKLSIYKKGYNTLVGESQGTSGIVKFNSNATIDAGTIATFIVKVGNVIIDANSSSSGWSVSLVGLKINTGVNILDAASYPSNNLPFKTEVGNVQPPVVIDYCKTKIGDITYSIEPCGISAEMVSGKGNKSFSFTIKQSKTTPSVYYGFTVYGYGEGFPTYGILGGASSGGATGDTKIDKYFSDQYLKAGSYNGYLKIGVYHGSASPSTTKELRLPIKLKVTPKLQCPVIVEPACKFGTLIKGPLDATGCQTPSKCAMPKPETKQDGVYQYQNNGIPSGTNKFSFSYRYAASGTYRLLTNDGKYTEISAGSIGALSLSDKFQTANINFVNPKNIGKYYLVISLSNSSNNLLFGSQGFEIKPVKCTSYATPQCIGGKLIDGGKDTAGCKLPMKCEMPKAACGPINGQTITANINPSTPGLCNVGKTTNLTLTSNMYNWSCNVSNGNEISSTAKCSVKKLTYVCTSSWFSKKCSWK